ncbi:nucleoside deaminase [Pusillimonas sp. TS35]|uniref:nucleoside deaminase n=1 Tax=Paracandidimonas lactea TaxID=2895524 RepID=UPI00136BD109|nr:nucleoside deaminase [Paracandidimonas lactea]MYN11901.1 nucleoside deaminase [Pusillimonas sp. TS35]
MSQEAFMREAVALARANIEAGGRPFGAVLVRDGQIIARAANQINQTSDPTAHAELLALREAGGKLGTSRLDGCEVYASGHPCPMCLAAMRLAGIRAAYFAYSNEDGEPFGMSTSDVYAELPALAVDGSALLQPLRPAGEEGLYHAWSARQVKHG